jgi:hypothetical protein
MIKDYKHSKIILHSPLQEPFLKQHQIHPLMTINVLIIILTLTSSGG